MSTVSEDIVYNKDGSIRKKLGRTKTLTDDEKADKRVVTYVNETEVNLIKEIAKVEARTNSFIIRQAIQEFIQNRVKNK